MPLRVLFLDPIGHVLGSHDHALCKALVKKGCEVFLGTNQYDPTAGDPKEYRRFLPYRRTFGDGHSLGKVFHYLRAIARIVREARAFQPDAAILYFAIQPHLDRLLVRRLERSGFRTIVCAHDVLPLESDRDRLGGFRRLYHAASGVQVFGRYARDQLVRRLGYPASRVAVSYLGIDHVRDEDLLGQAQARAELGIPPTEQIVLCIGIIKSTKGVDDLMRAFASLLDRHPRARLWILGRPRRVDVTQYLDLATHLGLGERLAFRPGYLSEQQFATWLQAADVVVHPDTRLYQSGVVQQACAYGRPIVATAVGNVSEVLQDGTSAWLVPAHQPAALATAISEALDDPSEAERRGREARKGTVRSSWSELARSLVELIRRDGSQPERA